MPFAPDGNANRPPTPQSEIRAEALARRGRQQNAEPLGRQILGRLAESQEYARAKTLLVYLSFRSEVATHDFPRQAWSDGKRVAVPYCNGEDLGLFIWKARRNWPRE